MQRNLGLLFVGITLISAALFYGIRGTNDTSVERPLPPHDDAVSVSPPQPETATALATPDTVRIAAPQANATTETNRTPAAKPPSPPSSAVDQARSQFENDGPATEAGLVLSDNLTTDVSNALKELADPKLRLDSVQCRATLCKVELVTEYQNFGPQLLPFLEMAFVRKATRPKALQLPPDSGRLTVFVPVDSGSTGSKLPATP